MNKTQLYTLVRHRLGFNDSLDVSVLDAQLDMLQNNYEVSLGMLPSPWFMFQTETLTTTIDVRTVEAPDNFARFDEDYELTILNADGTEFQLKRKLSIELQPYVADEGLPKYYAFDGSLLYLYPRPDAAYTIHFPYYGKSQDVWSDSEETLWLTHFPALILEEMVYNLSRSTRDKTGIQLSSVEFEKRNYLVKVEDMKHAMMEYSINMGA